VNADGHEDFILAIWVKYRSEKLVEATESMAYIRRGSSRRRLKPDEIGELQNAKGQVEVEREQVFLGFQEDLQLPVITQFASTVREMRRLPERLRVDEILELRHPGRISADKFVPNLACALMFAKDPQAVVPGCRVRFFRYNGTAEKTGADYNVIKDIQIDGTVPELIQETAQVIEAQAREFVRLGKDHRFYSVPEYPREAWYEALVNACAIDPIHFAT
jgi:ATP-dependent DNA helicase RecG